MRLPPLKNNIANLPNHPHSTCQNKYLGAKGRHSEEIWLIPNTTNGKANQARFEQTFPFQRILYMFHFKVFLFRIHPFQYTCIWLYLTRVIQNSITILCLHFFEKKYRWSDPSILSWRPAIPPHLESMSYSEHPKAESHCSHHCPEGLRGSSKRFPHKSKTSLTKVRFGWRLLFPHRTPDGSSQASNDIISLAL